MGCNLSSALFPPLTIQENAFKVFLINAAQETSIQLKFLPNSSTVDVCFKLNNNSYGFWIIDG